MYTAKSTTLLVVSACAPTSCFFRFSPSSFSVACVDGPSFVGLRLWGQQSSSTGALCPDGLKLQFNTIKGFVSIDCQCCAFQNCGFRVRICWISINGFRLLLEEAQSKAKGRRARSLKRVLCGPTLAHLASFSDTTQIPNRSIKASNDLMGQSLAWLLVAVPDFQPFRALCAESNAAHIASTILKNAL